MKNILNKIEYNSPVILTFSLLATAIFFIDQILPINLINTFFVYRGGFSLLGAIQMLLWPLGHASIDHLLGNITLILLIGPMLEEKYSSKIILMLIIITTFIIGFIQGIIFNTGILGASGVVFMMIILTSFTNMKDGKIPLTFIFIAILFLAKEIYNAFFVINNISELGHILGAIVGMGYIYIEQKRKKQMG
ncbi:MAG: rhomboid family intramembrane serine protease [Vallitalea sp.]|nr:rhomboid family intramembrane serine protease [Vallitalea sp.]